MKRTRTTVLALAAASLVLTACGGGGGGSGSSDVSMTLATPTWNAGVASVAVSEGQGYFEDEGLDMNVILVDSGTTQVTQIGTGRVTTGAVSPEPVIIGRQDGKDLDLQYYMSFYKKNIYGLSVPADSDIKTIADLEGKKVGAISLASVSVTQAKVGLEEAGVPADSVDFIAIGTGSQQATAIEKGQVDAVALLDTSFQVLENQGIALRPIEVPGTADLTSGGLAARAGDLRKDPDTYVKIGRAVAKGVEFAKTNPEAAIKILYKTHPEAKPSGLTDEQAITSGVKVLQSRLANLGVDDPEGQYGTIDPQMLQANTDFLLKAKMITKAPATDELYSDELISQINDFDLAEVRQQATDYDR